MEIRGKTKTVWAMFRRRIIKKRTLGTRKRVVVYGAMVGKFSAPPLKRIERVMIIITYYNDLRKRQTVLCELRARNNIRVPIFMYIYTGRGLM